MRSRFSGMGPSNSLHVHVSRGDTTLDSLVTAMCHDAYVMFITAFMWRDLMSRDAMCAILSLARFGFLHLLLYYYEYNANVSIM